MRDICAEFVNEIYYIEFSRSLSVCLEENRINTYILHCVYLLPYDLILVVLYTIFSFFPPKTTTTKKGYTAISTPFCLIYNLFFVFSFCSFSRNFIIIHLLLAGSSQMNNFFIFQYVKVIPLKSSVNHSTNIRFLSRSDAFFIRIKWKSFPLICFFHLKKCFFLDFSFFFLSTPPSFGVFWYQCCDLR